MMQNHGKTYKKGEDDSKASKKGEGNDFSVCGTACLTKPKVVYAPYIDSLIND